MKVGSTRRRPRRGMLGIAVMACLIVLVIIAGALIRAGVARRDALRVQERRLQADWLAEAGLARGLARLEADPSYHGETWTIEPRDLGTQDGATVVIAVEKSPTSNSRTLSVRADYPRDPPQRARRSRRVTIDDASREPKKDS